jgi:hypothetical protein
MPHQVEFLIEGPLLPPTIGTLCVSEKLLLESVWRSGVESRLSHEPSSYAIAYVGVATPEGSNYFLDANRYLDLFLLIYAFVSGQSVRSIMGIGTTFDDMSSLGTRRVGWPSFEKLHVVNERIDDEFCKPVLEAKNLFLQLLPERDKVMKGHLGLAFTFYYFAVLASRRRLEEAVTNLTIATEALLITEDEGKRQNLSKRLSTLVAANEDERIDISKKMLKLYDLRSRIVHGGGKRPSSDDVRTLFNYVYRAIERVISLRQLSKRN